MRFKTRAILLAAAACTWAGAAGAQAPSAPPAPAPAAIPQVAAPSVRAGVEAWQAGNYAVAIANWRPLADRNDADAQYNIAQAYFLGRGVPQNSNLAEQWYERAARQGHAEAQANYGLLLFQNGRRREAMPWIEQAANRGDPRAQYVFGTALYNGDLVPVDMPRAYAMMSRAAAAGLPPAISQLAAMEPHISAEDRARGAQLASRLAGASHPVGGVRLAELARNQPGAAAGHDAAHQARTPGPERRAAARRAAPHPARAPRPERRTAFSAGARRRRTLAHPARRVRQRSRGAQRLGAGRRAACRASAGCRPCRRGLPAAGRAAAPAAPPQTRPARARRRRLHSGRALT